MYTGSGAIKIITIYFGETEVIKWGVSCIKVFNESLKVCGSGWGIVWKLCWTLSSF